MSRVVTAEEMRRIEQRAAAEGQTSEALMERAGRGAARSIMGLMPRGARRRARVVVLCGPGNNGGDGLVVARELAARGVGDVCAYTCLRDPGRTPPQPLAALARVRAYTWEDDGEGRLNDLLRSATIIVDALLGTGQARPLEGDLAIVADAAREMARTPGRRGARRLVVALDLPTGLNADTGALDPHTLPADLTLTFGFPKRGLLLEPGAGACGRIEVVEIGLKDRLAQDVAVTWPTPADVAAMIPPRGQEANKYSAGAVLVVAGSPRFTGAPRLAALGAARAGAGLVTVATGGATQQLLAVTLVEMTFLPLADDPATGALDVDKALETIRPTLGRYRCVLIGPGLGQEKGTQGTVYALLAALREMGQDQRPGVVVDADGLNALAAHVRWWELLPPWSILTPHAGEMGRLRAAAGQEGGSRPVEANRLEVARSAAQAWGQVVVLKGAHTLVAAPDGRVAINPTGGPNLATGGTGDVLGGVIAGLVAQGAPPFEAAVAGAYVHGRAGDLLARRLGARGTLAGDLPGVIPGIIEGLCRPERELHDPQEDLDEG